MILVTGCTGFIGSNLVRKLINDGWKIAGLCRDTTDFSKVSDVYDRITWVNFRSIADFFSENKVEGIIHLATSYGRNGGFFDVFESNMSLPMHLLKYACDNGSSFFINTDSFFTNELAGGWHAGSYVYLDNYTKTKFAFREYVRSNIVGLGIKFINMQLQHVYGTGDSEGKFITFMKNSLLNNVEKIELTDGIQTRDWVYIDDVADAFLSVLQHVGDFIPGKFYDFEVGTGVETSLKDFCLKMKKESGAETELCFGNRERAANEIMKSVADNGSLRALGWTPQVSIEDGIRRLFEE